MTPQEIFDDVVATARAQVESTYGGDSPWDGIGMLGALACNVIERAQGMLVDGEPFEHVCEFVVIAASSQRRILADLNADPDAMDALTRHLELVVLAGRGDCKTH